MPDYSMPNYGSGLLAGIGSALSAGVDSYRAQKLQQREQAQQDFTHALLQMQIRNSGLEKGYQVDPTTGAIQTDDGGNPKLTPMASSIAQFGRQREDYKSRIEALTALSKVRESGGEKAYQQGLDMLGQSPQFQLPPQGGQPSGLDSPEMGGQPMQDAGGDPANPGGLIGLSQKGGLIGVQAGLLPQGPAKPQMPAQGKQASNSPFPPLKLPPPIPPAPQDMGSFERANYETSLKPVQDLNTRVAAAEKNLKDEDYQKNKSRFTAAPGILAAIQEAKKNPSTASNLPVLLTGYTLNAARMPEEAIEANKDASRAWLDKFTEKLARNKNGTLTDDAARSYTQYVQGLAKSSRKMVYDKETSALNTFSKSNRGYEPSELIPSILEQQQKEPVRMDRGGNKVYLNLRNGLYEASPHG